MFLFITFEAQLWNNEIKKRKTTKPNILAMCKNLQPIYIRTCMHTYIHTYGIVFFSAKKGTPNQSTAIYHWLLQINTTVIIGRNKLLIGNVIYFSFAFPHSLHSDQCNNAEIWGPSYFMSSAVVVASFIILHLNCGQPTNIHKYVCTVLVCMYVCCAESVSLICMCVCFWFVCIL